MDNYLKLNKMVTYTLNNNGGTFNKEGKTIKSGYVVAVKTLIKIKNPCLNIMMQYLNEALNTLQNNEVVGTWVNNNYVYIEISKIFNNLDDAIKCGKESNQIAIFDLENNQEIKL